MLRILDLEIIDVVNNTELTIRIEVALPVCNKRPAEHIVAYLLPNKKQFVASLWNIFQWTTLPSRAKKSILPPDTILCLDIRPTAFDGCILIDLHLIEFAVHQPKLFLMCFGLRCLLEKFAILLELAMKFIQRPFPRFFIGVRIDSLRFRNELPRSGLC